MRSKPGLTKVQCPAWSAIPQEPPVLLLDDIKSCKIISSLILLCIKFKLTVYKEDPKIRCLNLQVSVYVLSLSGSSRGYLSID